MKKINYLITGGSGFIGSALAAKLKGNILIISQSKPNPQITSNPNIKYHKKSLDDLSIRDVADVQVIYHLASTVDNYHVLTDPYLDTEVNINQTVRLLELCKKLDKKPKIIYLSTFFVYGNIYEKIKKPINENSPTEPLSLYPATKLCAESIIKLYGKLYNIPYLICRLTNIYGPGDKATDRKGVLNYFVNRAIKGKSLELYSGGKFIRDYLYIDDLIRALQIIEKKAANEMFLIGFGKTVTFKRMIQHIHMLLKSKSKIISIPSPGFHLVVGVNNFVADISKIRALGWKPQIDYKKGLKKLIDEMINKKINV